MEMVDHRSKRAQRALAHLPETDTGLAVLSIWCDTRDEEDQQTYLSGDVVYVGSDFSTLPLQEQTRLLGHHVLHVALRHELGLRRMQDRFGNTTDPDLHSLCSDALVTKSSCGEVMPCPAPSRRPIARSGGFGAI
jgi:hypothetical protein